MSGTAPPCEGGYVVIRRRMLPAVNRMEAAPPQERGEEGIPRGVIEGKRLSRNIRMESKIYEIYKIYEAYKLYEFYGI